MAPARGSLNPGAGTAAGTRELGNRLTTQLDANRPLVELVADAIAGTRDRFTLRAEGRARNRPGGYWIAETDPDAAIQAVIRRFPRSAVRAILLMTDGASGAVDV